MGCIGPVAVVDYGKIPASHMHKIFINDVPARTAQEVANAIHYSPESVCIESGPEISPDAYDGPLAGLEPDSFLLFMSGDGTIGELYVTARGERGVVRMSQANRVRTEENPC